MRFLALSNLWVFVATFDAPVVSSSHQILERDLFDPILDYDLFNDKPSLAGNDPVDQMIGLNSDELLADNVLDPITVSDSDWFLADNGQLDESDPSLFLTESEISCDASDLRNGWSIAKVRREDLCRDPPVGQAENSDQSSQNDPFDAFNRYINNIEPLAVFPKDLEICPPSEFDASNVPVCKPDTEGEVWKISRTGAFNLIDVDPGMAVSACMYRLCNHY